MESLALERGERGAGLPGQQQQRAVRRPLQQPLEGVTSRSRSCIVGQGRFACRARRAPPRRPEDSAEVLDVDDRHRDADQAGATRRERTGVTVHAEPLLADDAKHGLAWPARRPAGRSGARETVAMETPAASAMSRIVALRPFPPLSSR